jgi:hypothetical protein
MHSVRESYTHALTNYVLARALDRAIGQELGNTMCGLYCVRCFLSLRQMGNLDRVLAYGIMDVTLASKIADTATHRGWEYRFIIRSLSLQTKFLLQRSTEICTRR